MTPIPPSVAALCELFTNELANVKFPDVDASVLNAAVNRVNAQAEAVARAEAVLTAAREQLQEEQDALVQKAQRALAYAQVFSEENAELSAKLAEISLPRSKRTVRISEPAGVIAEVAPPKRRGRPPKVRAESGGLFQESAASGMEEQAAADA